jgi:hypothetical protein
LQDGSEFVDDDARDAVGTALDFGLQIGRAFTEAADEDAAFEAVDAVYAEADEQFSLELPGADWIQDTCGIDLED